IRRGLRRPHPRLSIQIIPYTTSRLPRPRYTKAITQAFSFSSTRPKHHSRSK
ncbi:hypothetical protein COCMIDRAFT_110532, partial [Bipolaris oryzae ATCC 44560]